MTEPSEREVEAVAKAMLLAEWGGLPDAEMEEFASNEWPGYEKSARAAIAAYEKAKAEEYERNTMS